MAGGEDIEVADNKVFVNVPDMSAVGLKKQNWSGEACHNIRFSNNLIRMNEAGVRPDETEFWCNSNGCDPANGGYWSKAMNVYTNDAPTCEVTDPTHGGAQVTNDLWRSNDVDATQLTADIYDELIPQCN